MSRPRFVFGAGAGSTAPVESLGERFVGRAALLRELDSALRGEGADAGSTTASVVALEGGAGIGKSQLAFEYAVGDGLRRFPGGVFWVDAAEASDEELARPLRATHREPRLVILDGVSEASDGRSPASLLQLDPGRQGVSVLVTSRHPVVGAARRLTVGALTVEDARLLLASDRRSDRRVPTDEECDEIADWVERVPLALKILDQELRHDLGVHDLISHLRSRPRPEGAEADSRTSTEAPPPDLGRGLWRALSLSDQRLSHGAQRAVRAAAILAPAPVPDRLLGELCEAWGGARMQARLTERSILARHAVEEPPAWTLHPVRAEFLRSVTVGEDESWKEALGALGTTITRESVQDPALRSSLIGSLPAVERLIERAPTSDGEEFAEQLFALGGALLELNEVTGVDRASRAAEKVYRQALREFSRESSPFEWASCQENVGLALSNQGVQQADPGKLEAAVVACRAALEVFTPERSPRKWASTMNNLGVALRELGVLRRDLGTLEESEAAYRASLEVCTREEDPLGWAMAQGNLGLVLQDIGEHREDATFLESAVSAYREVLKESGRERQPLDHALTQTNLGSVLRKLGERRADAKLLEQAESAYREALKDFSRERAPIDWARAQYNLGIALDARHDLIGDAEAREAAIEAYREALQEFTRERTPLDWAKAQYNLGYALLGKGGATRDVAALEAAEAAFESALLETDRMPEVRGFHRRNLEIVRRLLRDLRGPQEGV